MSDHYDAFDRDAMARALQLAALGLGTTSPNPPVGCVIARAGTIVGEGWHRRAGEAHAELLALQAAGDAARGATAYVTLEPCAHHGRTPPCADALIAAQLGRVVIAVGDPSSEVGGQGIARLRASGIQVDVGLLQDESRELARGFLSRAGRGRPWLRVKLAMSLDGRTALSNGDSKWITAGPARADVQLWRARSSALLTGSGTVLADDPRLTLRADEVRAAGLPEASHDLVAGAQPPLRVVLDRALRTPSGAQVLDGSVATLLFHDCALVPGAAFERVECLGLEIDGGCLDLHAVLQELAHRGCNEIQAEAGAILSGALWQAGLVDELLVYMAPLLLGGDARPLLELPALTDMGQRQVLDLREQRMVGKDMRLLLRPPSA